MLARDGTGRQVPPTSSYVGESSKIYKYKMDQNEHISALSLELVNTSGQYLRGEVDFITCIRIFYSAYICFNVKNNEIWDSIRYIESETDSLPTPEQYKLWHELSLKKQLYKISKAEECYKTDLVELCNYFIKEYGTT